MLNAEIFAAEFAGLCEVFDRQPTKALASAYYETLCDMSDEQFKSAILAVMKTQKFSKLPLPAEIRESICASKSVALVALDKAERAIERHGSYCAVVFDDPVIHMVISAMGGWARFCCPSNYGDDQEWHWKQKEFVSLYETFSKHPHVEVPLVLVGLGDTHFDRNGQIIPILPKFIGDKRAVIEWQGAKRKHKSITHIAITPDGPA